MTAISRFANVGWTLVALAFVPSLHAQGQDPQATGLRPPTTEELQWMDGHLQTTRAVKLNALGLDRVNAARRAKALPELQDVQAVPVGAEPQADADAMGAFVRDREAAKGVVQALADSAGLPSGADNSQLESFPEVRSQGSIGSCASFSTTYYVGTHMTGLARGWSNVAGDNTHKLSPKWTYALVNGGGDNGSWFSSTFDALLKVGAATWSDWPYSGTNTPSSYLEWCRDGAVWRRAVANRFDQVGRVQRVDTATGLAQAKALLANGYLLLYATDIYGWKVATFSDDPSTAADNAYVGQMVCRFVESNSSGHAMTIVGYNDDVWTDINKNGVVDAGEKGALKVVNSWGTTGFGNSGFGWIAYDALRAVSLVPTTANSDHTVGRASGYRSAFWGSEVYWITARPAYTPVLLAEFTLSAARRNQLWLRVGRSSTSSSSPSAYWPVTTTAYSDWLNGTGWPETFKYLGGAYAFDGSTSAVSSTMVLDLSDLVASGTQRYYLEVQDSTAGSTASVSAFKLVSPEGVTLATASSGLPFSADASTGRAYVDFAFDSAPVIGSATTAAGTVGQAFTYQITATNTPTSFSAGNLPSGLSVNASSGAISGTPTQSGSFAVSLGATNASGTGTATLSLSINAAPVQTPAITSATTASATVGVSFSYQITATNTPTLYSATGLPAGLSVNTSTGLISGTPTAAGSYSVSLAAANTGGFGAARSLTITVGAPPVSAPVITSPGTATGASGSAFTYRIVATNVPTGYGAAGLPDGLTINTATGVISGTLPVARAYSVVLSATNAGGTGYKTLDLQVTGESSFGPANDAFANRIPLAGTNVTTTGSSVNASVEAGEPAHAGSAAARSVWWTWTAPGNGQVTIDTAGSDFDTRLGVYTGSAIEALAAVASNDNGTGVTTSTVTLSVTGGSVLQIAVDGVSGAQGAVTLHIAYTGAAPANDNFVNRIEISGTSVSTTGVNVGASSETGEPLNLGYVPSRSVWWTWTAPQTGRVVIDTIGSTFDTLLSVHTGPAVTALTPVGGNDDGGGNGTSRLVLDVTVGAVLQIVVDGWSGAQGTVALNLAYAGDTPDNDAFANRIALGSGSVSTSGTNVDATAEAGEPNHAGYVARRSVWWSWTAGATGLVTIDTTGSGFDTVLAVYTGTSLTALTPVAADDDGGGNSTSRVQFSATVGSTYQIAVDGWAGRSGSVVLNVDLDDSAPSNDDFADRALLSGATASVTTSNTVATAESGEPAHVSYSVAAHSLWWRWTAEASGRVELTTAGSGFDTILAVYTGTSVDALTLLAANDDWDGSTTSTLTFFATAGTTYAIAVDGYNGASGSLILGLLFTETDDLYFTDFEAFDSGADTLAGTDGWETNVTTNGQTGIFAGFGGSNTAWLGYADTDESVVMAWRPLNYNPVAAGTPLMRFSCDVAVIDSTNGAYDNFFFMLANADGQFLGGINFDNTNERVYRYDGASYESVGTYATGTRLALVVTMDFSAGTWSATLDGATLFEDRVITTTGRALTLGEMVALWQISSAGTPGDNFMIFDNYRISVVDNTPPANDAFASATALSGTSVQVTGRNVNGTVEGGEPTHAARTGGASVWWTWTAPSSGTATIATAGSGFDTLLAVYTGTSVSALSEVASNDDNAGSTSSLVSFAAAAGTTYRIAVDGYHAATGSITLSLEHSSKTPASVALSALSQTYDGSPKAATALTDPSGLAVTLTYNGSSTAPTAPGAYTVVATIDDPVFEGSSTGTFSILPAMTMGQAGTVAATAGGTTALDVSVQGATGATYQWQRYDASAGMWLNVTGATSDTYSIRSVQTWHGTQFRVLVTVAGATATSDTVTIDVSAPPVSASKLMNISTRALCLTGSDVLIPGFVINGTGTKRLLIRAAGPELTAFGVGNALSDPVMVLKRQVGADYVDYATNDSWGTNANAADIAAEAAARWYFALSEGSASAALLLDLPAGSYTVVASGKNDETGVAIVEVYDIDESATDARLVNISNRGYVGTGGNIMIPGFVVSEEGSKTFLIRAVGPTLASFNVAGTLSDPQVAVFDRFNTRILENDDWGENGDGATVAAVAASVWAFGLQADSLDSAMVVTLPPGAYTVQASGVGGATGVALVEIYQVE